MVELGHYVLYVREMQPMVDFYTGIVGLDVVGTTFGGRATALSGGRTHHELLLLEVGDAPGPMRGHRVGLYHTGWCIGKSDMDLVAAKNRCLQQGVRLVGQSDHGVSHSLYLLDPDGNEVELYIDVEGFDWREDASWLEYPVRPLYLPKESSQSNE
jgi:catechol 2,3-dioxygenase